MAGAKLNEADASRLARHYGRSVSEMAAVVGQDAETAAAHLGLDPADLSGALEKSALNDARRLDEEETRRAAARRDANYGSEQPAPALATPEPVEEPAKKTTAKKTAKKAAKKTPAKKTAAKKTAAKKTAKKAPAKKTAKRAAKR